MIKEIRKLKTRQEQRYIRNLMERGVLSKNVSLKGYLAYDTEEYKRVKSAIKIGRPAKSQKSEAQRAREDTLREMYNVLLCEIRDSGKAIDEATLNKIFNKGEQGND